jgi:hypothetical protein
MVERSTQTVRFARDKYNLNEIVDIVKAIIERIDHTSMTVHAPDYNEDKQADNSSVCFRPDKQALPRFPHAVYILSSSELRWKPFIHTPKHRLLARPWLPPPTPCFLSRRSNSLIPHAVTIDLHDTVSRCECIYTDTGMRR